MAEIEGKKEGLEMGSLFLFWTKSRTITKGVIMKWVKIVENQGGLNSSINISGVGGG